jgi:hypothetical protein
MSSSSHDVFLTACAAVDWLPHLPHTHEVPRSISATWCSSVTRFQCLKQATIIPYLAYRPVAKWWLREQQMFLGSGSVNTFLLLDSIFLIMQQLDYNGNRTFSTRSVATSCYKQGTRLGPVSWQLNSAREVVKKWPERVKLKNLHC